MIAILGWIIFGLIAGLIAKAIMPGRDPGGFIITMLLGIAGSLIGYGVYDRLDSRHERAFHAWRRPHDRHLSP